MRGTVRVGVRERRLIKQGIWQHIQPGTDVSRSARSQRSEAKGHETRAEDVAEISRQAHEPERGREREEEEQAENPTQYTFMTPTVTPTNPHSPVPYTLRN